MIKKNKQELNDILADYKNHPKVLEMKHYSHHGIRRYDHCYRVAYYTYKVTKFLNLNYHSATKAAMLHDFYTNELEEESSSVSRFRKHPEIALENAKKYFEINEMEADIISSHMFPVTNKPPKYLESWIVDLIDDGTAIYEKASSMKREIQSFASVMIFMIFTFLR